MAKKIIAVIGARPQFIKHAPIEIAFKHYFDLISIHTGQHYDKNMSQIFFEELGINIPKYKLEIGSHNHGLQTGRMMIEIEPIIEIEKPDAILVYGDTNSTLAGALVGAKLHVPIIHIEAGLRSFNKKMPEEINRIITDHISSLLFIPTKEAEQNLKKEGIVDGVFYSGDVMNDMIRISKEKGIIRYSKNTKYYYATIHRPYNTDKPNRLKYILENLNILNHNVIFSTHPRTKYIMNKYHMKEAAYSNIKFISPTSYFENINLQANAQSIITDSGGMQKEAFLLGVKCVTIRTETEWKETLIGDWNTLIFEKLENLQSILEIVPTSKGNEFFGNGHAATEIAQLVYNHLNKGQ